MPINYDPMALYVGGLIASMLWVLAITTLSKFNTSGLVVALVCAILWPIAVPVLALVGALRRGPR